MDTENQKEIAEEQMIEQAFRGIAERLSCYQAPQTY